ncbi:MAG: hypothetical protein ACI9K1_000375 [Arcticibacterium sp.]|jgi:hypothetical protein
MITRIRFILILFFGSFFMQAQISLKKNDSEIKQINSAVTEQKAVSDQSIFDDLIVTGSACIGLDCVNNESFGFDTIRLKENNLRIKALDTSSSASFPTNDWEITFNDSANGGQNKFSIDDVDGGRTPFTIEANAPSHSLYVDDGGRIGLGTSTPVVEIHSKDGNTPTLRLEQDGSSGFGAQTWDVGGNESNFFIRDATNGSSLPFRIMASAPNSSLYIAADGDIGFETTTPDGQLDIAHSANGNDHALLVSPTSAVGINIDNGFLPKGLFDVQTTGGISNFTVSTTGVYVKNAILPGASAPSDERLKQNIVALTDATNVLMKVYPKSYFYREDIIKKYGFSEKKQFGIVAQDLEKVLPELVTSKNLGQGDFYKTVNYNSLIPILIQALKEQKLRIDELESEVADYASLESRLNSIEAKLSSNSKNAKR